MSSRFASYHFSAFAAALLALSACDNTVDPFVTSDADSFAIYGYLDSEADTQFVRISPVIDAAGFVYADALGAMVYLVSLHSGERLPMEDSSVVVEDDRRSYFYYAVTTPLQGAEYRLDVFRPGGDTTRATTRMPGIKQIDVHDPTEDVNDNVVQRINWIDVSTVRNILVHYHIRRGTAEETVTISYPAPSLTGPNITVIQLERDRGEVLDRAFPGTDRRNIALLDVAASAEMLSPEWELNPRPVRNFFGSIGHVRKEWTLPDSTVIRLGYHLP